MTVVIISDPVFGSEACMVGTSSLWKALADSAPSQHPRGDHALQSDLLKTLFEEKTVEGDLRMTTVIVVGEVCAWVARVIRGHLRRVGHLLSLADN